MSAPIGDPANPPADPADPQVTDPVDPQAPAPADPPADQSSEPDTFDRAAMEKARGQAARYRTERNDLATKVDELTAAEAQSKAQLDAVLKALGLGEAEEVDPAKLLEQVTSEKATIEAERDAERQELRALRIDNAVQAACREANADTVLTSAVLTTSGKLDALDPTADDFMAQVAALVGEAVNGNPKLKASQVEATASGPDPQQSATPKGDPAGPDGWRAKLFPSS